MVSVEGELSITAMAAEAEKAVAELAADEKTTDAPQAKKVKAPASHPPYRKMITEAISELNEGNGSSQQAISKFVEEKYKPHLSSNFKKMLLTQLKNLTKTGELTRTKNSFKLNQTAKKADVEPAKIAEPPGGEANNAGKTLKAAKVSKAKKKMRTVNSSRKASNPRKTPKSIKNTKAKAGKSSTKTKQGD